MKNRILSLENVVLLSKEQQKLISGGKRIGGAGTVCKATCKDDGSLVTVSGCSDLALACSTSGGAVSCRCDYPSPFDPPQ